MSKDIQYEVIGVCIIIVYNRLERVHMAVRPVFLAKKDTVGIDTINVDFQWFPGFSTAQKQRSIKALHAAFITQYPTAQVVEISSKSPIPMGTALSAFNLSTTAMPGYAASFNVEAAFQGSKVFEQGGPFCELIGTDARQARKDERLRNSGALTAFQFGDLLFPLIPHTFFYDWLYINVLLKNEPLMEALMPFNAFTDIEFNPKRSLNCQAGALALFTSLRLNNVPLEDLRDPRRFKTLAYPAFV